MAAKYILAILAAGFLTMASVSLVKGKPYSHPQVRTWLLTALIFAAVSVWLFQR